MKAVKNQRTMGYLDALKTARICFKHNDKKRGVGKVVPDIRTKHNLKCSPIFYK